MTTQPQESADLESRRKRLAAESQKEKSRNGCSGGIELGSIMSRAVEAANRRVDLPSPPEPEPEVSHTRDAMEAAGVPDRYRDYALSDFDIQRPDWSRGGYCLRGETGCGKSSLAGALVRDALERELVRPGQVAWVSVPVFVERGKSAAKPGSPETSYSILRAMLSKRLVVIDDYGRERDHDWDKALLGTLLWQAWDHRQKIILTTQLKLKDFYAFDAALGSRLATLAEVDLEKRDRRAEGKD